MTSGAMNCSVPEENEERLREGGRERNRGVRERGKMEGRKEREQW